jgi:oligopeptide/dipeptide ABC transporter ATP-binding protein
MYGISSKNVIAIAACIILAVFITGCNNSEEAKSAETADITQPSKVKTASVALRDFQYSVQANGTLIAQRHTKLNALVAGQVESIPVDIGDRLKKGKLLFRIREVDYELAYRQAEANLTRAEVILKDRKREKERMQNLFKAGSATQQAWDRAITAYEEAEAALSLARVARDIARQSLKDCTIRPPYDCVVTARYIEQGEYAKKGNTIVEIMDLTVLNAELELPERYAGKIVEKAAVNDLFSKPHHPYTEGLLGSIPRLSDTQRHFVQIPDTVPHPMFKPTGCYFHPRCKYATEKCKQSMPPLETIDGDRQIRCFYPLNVDKEVRDVKN